MDKKKALIPILAGVLAVILLAVFFLREPEPASPVETGPAAQSQTTPTLPGLTAEPEVTESMPAETTEPEQTTEPKETDPQPSAPEGTEPDHTEPDDTEPEQTGPLPTLPPIQPSYLAQLEGGLLTVRNLFQFSGMNPDADNEFGDDIAGVELTNNSEHHMTFAEVTAILEDGTILTFQAEDVPAGRTVMAFSMDHTSVKDVRNCEEVYGYAEFENGDLLLSEQVHCSANGAAITVKNLTGEELTDLEVICHGLLDSSFFGGSTYRYNVSTLPAGASTVIYVEECILGMVEVVRVDRGG